MKKLLLTAFLLSVMLVSAVSAAPSYIIDFNNSQNFDVIVENDCETSYTDTEIVIVSTNGPGDTENSKGDVHCTYSANIDDAEKAQWMKLRLKNESDAKTFEMHFSSAATGGINASTCTHFPISAKDTEFKEYVFNIKEYNLKSQSVNKDVSLSESVWKGAVDQLRFDYMWIAEPSGQVPTGSKMTVDYVAFFATEEEAKAYTHTEILKPEDNTDYSKVDFLDGFTYIFSNEEDFKKWRSSGANISMELGFMRFSPTTGDPYISHTFTEDEVIDTAQYRYAALQYKANTTIKSSVYFVSSSEHPNYADAGHKSFPVIQNRWDSKIIDLSANPFWKGTATGFRWDIINGNDLNADILIERIGFFKTEEQAKAFLSQANTTPDYSRTITNKSLLQTVIIPGGSLSDGYDINEYIMSDVTLPEGDTVVKFTDKDGNQSIVALGYTNGAGYTTFVSRNPGSYTLTSNRKAYTDIAGHWGEEYINFVSDRTLFGGTSPTEFSPETTMTRGMFITVLGRMHGLDTAKYDGNTGYSDVNSAEYYAPYIQWAKEMGIMAPVSDAAFAPEEPISREVMARVISDYVKAYGYDIPTVEVKDFEDISAADAANADAIRFVQSLGIINGNTPTTFDPKGISTRAEVATVMQRVIKCILGIPLKYNTTFNNDRIMIGGWTNFRDKIIKDTDGTIKMLAESGIDFAVATGEYDGIGYRKQVLDAADKYGVQMTFHNYPAKYFENEADVPFADAEYYEHSAFLGHHIIDEPGSDQFPELGKIADQYKKHYPGKVPFYNLLPMYANAAQLKFGAGAAAIEYYDSDPDLYRKHLEAYVENIDTHYICVDIYPLRGGTSLYGDYCKNMDIFGTVCRENGRDFWLYVQTVGLSLDVTPDEKTLRWQFYTGLSFGVKTFIHFTYGSYNELSYPNWTYSMVKNDGTPTPTYYAAQTVNNEMHAISDAYVQYKNVGAFNVNCTSTTPYLKFDNQYTTDFIKVDTKNPLLVGCFEKKEGEGKAFTLVNMESPFGATSANVNFTLEHADTVTVYDKGVAEVITPNEKGVYNVILSCGQGVFVTVE